MEQEYYIYQITCIPTNKSYIGQTQKYKYKQGKPYQYGVAGRWCDHVSSAKRSDTPLHQAIREHGLGNFTHQILETVTEETADVREAYWISLLHSSVPNGYNVASHSRCKHRTSSNVSDIYPDATSVELKHIHRDGIPRLVYIYVDTPAGRKRLTFGQGESKSYERALEEAQGVLDQYQLRGVPVKQDKHAQFMGQQLKRIRLVPFNKTMVAIYITDQTNQQTRICFGGKCVTYEDAKQNAYQFLCGLTSDYVEDNLSKESATGGSPSG